MNSLHPEPIADILLVDDDPAAIRLLARCLAGVAGVRFATGGAEALALARLAPPDMMLLDADMPGMSGFDVCRAFKADEALADVPVVFVTSHSEQDFEVAGFDAGAADFIAKPFNPSLVLARVKAQLRVKRMADELRHVCATDGLTGVANRRRFDQTLDLEWRRALRSGAPLSLMMLDVDRFKAYNDRYGHPAGDACLRDLAQALALAARRPADLVVRFGGEEFAVLLPDTAREGAVLFAARVVDAIAALDIEHAGLRGGRVTASLGLACYDASSPAWVEPSADSRFDNSLHPRRIDARDLLRAADVALYAAKNAGRAQGWLLDVADAETPLAARRIARWRTPVTRGAVAA